MSARDKPIVVNGAANKKPEEIPFQRNCIIYFLYLGRLDNFYRLHRGILTLTL